MSLKKSDRINERTNPVTYNSGIDSCEILVDDDHSPEGALQESPGWRNATLRVPEPWVPWSSLIQALKGRHSPQSRRHRVAPSGLRPCPEATQGSGRLRRLRPGLFCDALSAL